VPIGRGKVTKPDLKKKSKKRKKKGPCGPSGYLCRGKRQSGKKEKSDLTWEKKPERKGCTKKMGGQKKQMPLKPVSNLTNRRGDKG